MYRQTVAQQLLADTKKDKQTKWLKNVVMYNFYSVLIRGTDTVNCELWFVDIPPTFQLEI